MLTGIMHNATAQKVGIGTSTPSNALEVVAAPTSSSNAAIFSTNTGTAGSGVLGVSSNENTFGVRGGSNLGTGVQAYTNGGIALAGIASGGTAITAQSSTGYGLIISGKIRIRGGNTTPSNGAVLTSDATGNATWKRSGLAFYANVATNTMNEDVFTKVEFSNEEFDTQNNFEKYAGAATTTSSVFTAPVAGVYHFSAALLFEKPGVADQNSNDILSGAIKLKVNGFDILRNHAPYITHRNNNGNFSCYVYLALDTDIHLSAGAKVWIEAMNEQLNAGVPIALNNAAYNGRFNGELIFAD